MTSKICVAAIAFAAAMTVPVLAQASQAVLYRTDFTLGTDYLGQALADSGNAITSTGGSLAGMDLSAYGAIVYANQDYGMPSGDLALLQAYVQGGGYVIFDDWTTTSLAGVSATGNDNLNSLNVGSLFSAGLASPLSVVNTGWGIYSYGLNAGAGNVVAATFENGDAAIVVADSGHVIYNGFLADTVASATLYANELGSMGLTTAVPEPENVGLMVAGLALVGMLGRRRKAA